MLHLKEKSNFNTLAATSLIDKGLYAPSVHCAYYGFFQMMMFKMHDFFGMSATDLEREIGSSKKGTHRFILDYVIEKLCNAGLPRLEVQHFKRKAKDIKRFRTNSDYKNVEVNAVDGRKALALSKELLEYLTVNL